MSSILMVVALIVLMAGGYMVARKKARLREAASLPFYKTELSEIADGQYEGKTYTSFLHLQLRVTIEDHKIIKIDVLENDWLEDIRESSAILLCSSWPRIRCYSLFLRKDR